MIYCESNDKKICSNPIDITLNGGVVRLRDLICVQNVIIKLFRLLLKIMNLFSNQCGLWLPKETSNLKIKIYKKRINIDSISIRTVASQVYFVLITTLRRRIDFCK